MKHEAGARRPASRANDPFLGVDAQQTITAFGSRRTFFFLTIFELFERKRRASDPTKSWDSGFFWFCCI